MSRSFRTEVEDLLRRTGTTVNFQFFYELSIRTDGVSLSTNPQGSWLARESGGFGSDTQTFNQTAQIILSLDSYMDTFAQFNVSMPQAFYPLMQEDSYGEVKTLQPPQDVTLEFERPSNDDQSAVAELPYWSLRVDGSKPMFEVDYEKTTPPLLGSPGSLTIIGIYATVIYTIGRILRLYFQDRSKFVLYEELPDTQLLLDLCNGIYIARIQGQLVAEYHLYYELIRILRSPELLLEVSQRSRATQLARRGTDLDGGTLGGHGTGRPPSPLPPRLGRSSRSLAAAARTPHGAAGARS
ncbi:unnamed protein product [Prorocentrum cordatum]|uniref:Piezo non-specific cation channel cap domain-containing protein n=1 Tax=Prorocentrum cordatum TaxID=2364126 RepID=A0ABN9Q9Q7_9DINO|nr:unnamed protein product [Polarella glacialis]